VGEEGKGTQTKTKKTPSSGEVDRSVLKREKDRKVEKHQALTRAEPQGSFSNSGERRKIKGYGLERAGRVIEKGGHF